MSQVIARSHLYFSHIHLIVFFMGYLTLEMMKKRTNARFFPAITENCDNKPLLMEWSEETVLPVCEEVLP
jgi:hypothetical protein